MPEMYCNFISSNSKKASGSVYITILCSSRLSDASNDKDSLTCVSLISNLPEIRSSPEGKVSNEFLMRLIIGTFLILKFP
jgi:hypothetical protein